MARFLLQILFMA